MKTQYTKLITTAAILVSGIVTYFCFSGPASDRRFLLWCLAAGDAVVLPFVLLAPIVRCPRCQADMGYFRGIGPLRRLRTIRPRYVTCKKCGCVLDRWNDREVD